MIMSISAYEHLCNKGIDRNDAGMYMFLPSQNGDTIFHRGNQPRHVDAKDWEVTRVAIEQHHQTAGGNGFIQLEQMFALPGS